MSGRDQYLRTFDSTVHASLSVHFGGIKCPILRMHCSCVGVVLVFIKQLQRGHRGEPVRPQDEAFCISAEEENLQPVPIIYCPGPIRSKTGIC